MKKTNQFDDIKAGELIRFLKIPCEGTALEITGHSVLWLIALKPLFAFTLSEDPHIQKASLSGTTE